MKGHEIYIGGVKVDYNLSSSRVLQEIENFIKDSSSHYIVTVNSEFVIDAQKDEIFRKIINEADIAIPDGIGLLYAKFYLEKISKFNRDVLFIFKALIFGIYFGISSLIKRYELGERIDGVSLTYKMCKLANEKGYTVFLLGGRPRKWKGKFGDEMNTALKAASKLKEIYPVINMIGAASEFNHDESDDTKTLEYIRECMKKNNVNHIDMLFVAYGHNKQEKWIVRNINKIPVKVAVGVGATIDYIVGVQKRSSDLWINKNLEWFYRLITQPWRFKRIFKAFPLFPLFVFLLGVKQKNQ